MTSQPPYKVSIIGYGLSAKIFHLPFILALPQAYTLHSIVQRPPSSTGTSTSLAKNDYPHIKHFSTSEEMVEDEEVDLVIVTTPPESHAYLVKLALGKGKNVVLEKPAVATSGEMEELMEVAKKSGKLFTVYHNRRWDSDFLTVQELILSNKFGRLSEFETHFDRHRPHLPPNPTWKNFDLPGGGGIFDLGTHLLDQVLVLFGLPQRVMGIVDYQREGQTGQAGDSFTALLWYESKLLVTAKAAVVSPEERQLRYWIRGEKGSYKKFGLDPQEDQLKQGVMPGQDGYGIESESSHGTLTTIQNDQPKAETYPTVPPATYTEYYKILAKALAGEVEVPVKPEEVRDLARLIELAKDSWVQKKWMDL